MSEWCAYCHGARLVGWSGAGPILCPTCSRDKDAFTVITEAWREQRFRAAAAESALAREKARADELEAACAAMRERLEVRSVGALSTDDGPRWECDLCEATGTIDAVNARGEFSQPDVVHAPGCELASDAGRALLAERDRLRAAVKSIADGGWQISTALPPRCGWCGFVDRSGGGTHDDECPASIARIALAAGIDDAKGG